MTDPKMQAVAAWGDIAAQQQASIAELERENERLRRMTDEVENQEVARLYRWQRRAKRLVEYATIELEARGFDCDRLLWEDGKRLLAEAGGGQSE